MRKLIRLLTVKVIVLAFAFPAYADGGDADLGAELYAEFCSNCHGADKSGLTEFNDDAATFNDRLEGMTEEMPDFAGFFDPEEIDAMYAYMSSGKTAE